MRFGGRHIFPGGPALWVEGTEAKESRGKGVELPEGTAGAVGGGRRPVRRIDAEDWGGGFVRDWLGRPPAVLLVGVLSVLQCSDFEKK